MDTVIIYGSSRKDGNTAQIVQQLRSMTGWELIDLSAYKIQHYNYSNEYYDDYPALIENIIDQYTTLVFVTPVYWYTMSAVMKIFFDRFTDLLTVNKDTGRRLRGKKMAVVSTSAGDHSGDAFWIPFQKTAQYLGMEYLGHLHTIEGTDDNNAIQAFADDIASKSDS